MGGVKKLIKIRLMYINNNFYAQAKQKLGEYSESSFINTNCIS